MGLWPHRSIIAPCTRLALFTCLQQSCHLYPGYPTAVTFSVRLPFLVFCLPSGPLPAKLFCGSVHLHSSVPSAGLRPLRPAHPTAFSSFAVCTAHSFITLVPPHLHSLTSDFTSRLLCILRFSRFSSSGGVHLCPPIS